MPPLPAPSFLQLELEAAQRPEWAAASGLFDWGALLLPIAGSEHGMCACVCVRVVMFVVWWRCWCRWIG